VSPVTPFPDLERAREEAAQWIARAFRGAFAWSRKSAASLARDTAEFLTEEGRDLVARAELDTFLDDVDAVRERADRLAARVGRLVARGPVRA